MNKFYLVYSILLILSESLFVWETIKYFMFVSHSDSRLEDAVGEEYEFILSKARQALIRAFSFLAISMVGFYITVDCIKNIWQM